MTDLQAAFARVPFHSLTRVELLDDLRVRAPDRMELKNTYGTMHGAMLFSLGEIAAAAAMVHMLGQDLAGLRAITRRGSIEYKKPAQGAITAMCQVSMTRAQIEAALAQQRSLDVPIVVTLTDDAGVIVATLNVDWFIGRPRDSPQV